LAGSKYNEKILTLQLFLVIIGLTDWKKVGIQSISYIIASGLILSGFNTFYNDFYNKPHIDTEWKLAKDRASAEIIVRNDGRIPATHLVLTLQTPQDMTKNTPDIFRTVNITLRRFR
jgi:hypothetical protein